MTFRFPVARENPLAVRKQEIARELLTILAFLILPTLLFWPVTLGGKTLLPFDNLYAWLPWKAFAEEMGVSLPQNELLSDLILENYAWKSFVLEAVRTGQIPLWNPYLFSGVPFLAAGQHSALYPLSIIYWLLPLPQAYGWFSLLHFFLAATFAYFFLRILGLGRFAGFVGGTVYSSSLFMVVHVVFPMILAAVTWLPLLLVFVELAVRAWEEPDKPHRILRPLPYLLAGSVILGLQFLAGHIEFSYYNLLVTLFYIAARLGIFWWHRRDARQVLTLGAGFLAMLALGGGLGAVQLLPLYELVRFNFRQASADYSQIISYAYPLRQIITFFLPDFFGNPSHHSYFDLVGRQVLPFTTNAWGQAIDYPFWGIKNYVEGGAYVGILPLALAALAVLRQRNRYVLIFLAGAVISLLFVFGTPLYALPFYLLPGYQQLHTPFRWVYPYTLAVAVLAAYGAQFLTGDGPQKTGFLPRLVSGAVWALGILLLALVAIIYAVPARFIGWADGLLTSSPLAQNAFSDGAAFLSYQWQNLVLLASATSLAGLALILTQSRWRRWGQFLAAGGLLFDLFLIGRGFNPAVDTRLAEFTPPAIEFLQSDKTLFRITTFDRPGEKLLNANSGMYFGLPDIRGYDSIIPKQYTDFISLIETQGELLYNRVAPLYGETSLNSPLLDLLNVKYVLTTQEIAQPAWKLVYDGEIKIYENEDYLPRAFAVPNAEYIPDEEILRQRLLSFNPREVVLLEEEPPQISWPTANPSAAESQVEIIEYSLNEVIIQARMPWPGWLILTDSYFPGWVAYVSTAGETEEEAHIYRADYNFRAVPLSAGDHTVRFPYSPLSFRLGLYGSFLSGMLVILGFAVWAWNTLYREDESRSTVWRVAKNSLVPMATSLLNKTIDLGFALLMLRILGPEGQGKYGFAIFVIGYFEIFTNFGLGTLLAREVAKEKDQANRYLSHTAILRLILFAVAVPLVLVFILAWRFFFNLPGDTITTMILLAIALVPSNLAAALSSLFTAYEKMEYPAALSTLATILKVSLGVLVLLFGFGFVGLAFVSLIVNLFTLAFLYWLVVRTFFRPRMEFDSGLGREILKTSYPLMINHLLSTLFFRVDVTLLQPLQGDRVVGWYTTPYKILDGLNIIPSTFTIAVFPVISRLARDARESLLRAYLLSLKWLIIISLPITLLIFYYAEGLILILGGEEFLPHSAIALQLLIWFLPFSFINSLTHYVLIALNQQAFLTRAFIIGFGFNLAANLIFIPIYSYPAAAVITVVSELALLFPFYYGIRLHLAPLPWWHLSWRPAAAALAMGVALLLLRDLSFVILVPLSLLIYGGTLLALGTFDDEDRRVLRSLIPPLPFTSQTLPESQR